MMQRFFLTMAGVALVTFALGCGDGDGRTGGGDVTYSGPFETVGFSQVGEESSWRTAETNSIRGEAQKRGIDLRFSDGRGRQENQIAALDGFIAQGVDAIVLAPVVETGWEQPLRKAE